MIDVIAAHGWELEVQSFLEIEGTPYTLSVAPEFTYFTRDEEGHIIRSRTPVGYKLNCAVQGPRTVNGHVTIDNLIFVEFNEESDFYQFMIDFKREAKTYLNNPMFSI
jgi:hypothetical protein